MDLFIKCTSTTSAESKFVFSKEADHWFPDFAEGVEDDNSVQWLPRQLSPPVSALEVLDPPNSSQQWCHRYQGD